MTRLTEVEGIGEVYAQKLSEAGIMTTEALLEKGATPQGRKEIAESSGISGALILTWVNHVDLFRVKGVGYLQGAAIHGHDLHQPLCAGPGNRSGVEIGLGFDDGFDQRGVDPMLEGGFFNDRVVQIRGMGTESPIFVCRAVEV